MPTPGTVPGAGGVPARSQTTPARCAACRYASTLPYLLAAPGLAPDQVAAILAARLARRDWIAEATPATGHLTVTVTGEAMAALAVRIPRAPDCARSDILRGLRVPAAATAADLAGSPGWRQAHVGLAAEVTARLANSSSRFCGSLSG